MRHSLAALPLALAALFAGAGASAQSNVTVFGLIDLNVASLRASGTGTQTLMGTDGYQSSRLGFRGTEDLGGGMSASFWLEGAMSNDDGRGGSTNLSNQSAGAVAAGGLTFARRSTVSLTSNMGELRVGRDYVPGFLNLSNFAAFGTNGVGNSGLLFYPVQSAARVTNVRASNSIGYFLPNLGGVYGQAMIAFGENASSAGATADDGKVSGLRLGYASGPFDGAVATTQTRISAVGNLTQTNLGASYDFGVVRPMLLWNQNKVGTTSVRSTMISGLIPVGAGQIRLAYATARATGIANDADQWTLGYVHNLSKRSALYANYSRISNKGVGTNYNVGLAVTAAGGSSNGLEMGIRHSF